MRCSSSLNCGCERGEQLYPSQLAEWCIVQCSSGSFVLDGWLWIRRRRGRRSSTTFKLSTRSLMPVIGNGRKHQGTTCAAATTYLWSAMYSGQAPVSSSGSVAGWSGQGNARHIDQKVAARRLRACPKS